MGNETTPRLQATLGSAGLQFARVVIRHDLDRAAGIAASGLLNRMSQLMREQAPAGRRGGRVAAMPENEVPADGVGLRAHGRG